MVLVHHRPDVGEARLQVGEEFRIAQRAQIDRAQRTVTCLCCRLHLHVPAADLVAPDPLVHRPGGDLGAPTDLGPDPLRVLRTIWSRHVEGLRLVIDEPVDHTHRQHVEEQAVARERLGEPPIEAGRVDVLHHPGLRHRIVSAVLLPGSGPWRFPRDGRHVDTPVLPARRSAAPTADLEATNS